MRERLWSSELRREGRAGCRVDEASMRVVWRKSKAATKTTHKTARQAS